MNNNVNKSNSPNDDGAIKKKRITKTKIIILAIFVLMVTLTVIFFTVPGLWDSGDGAKNSGAPKQYIFFEPYPDDFDIFTYDEYINRGDIGFVYLDDSTGESTELNDASVNDYNDGVQVMYEMIEAIKHGDHEAYNALLSDNLEKKKAFTQQQVYAITVTGLTSRSTDSGYEFKVEYKIRQNNGSFRTDIGSDMARVQYFTVKRIGNKYLIDKITESKNK